MCAGGGLHTAMGAGGGWLAAVGFLGCWLSFALVSLNYSLGLPAFDGAEKWIEEQHGEAVSC